MIPDLGNINESNEMTSLNNILFQEVPLKYLLRVALAQLRARVGERLHFCTSKNKIFKQTWVSYGGS